MIEVDFLLLAATRPWALGALISILGFGGLAVMFGNRWHESDTVGELTIVFGLMAVGPILCLLPAELRHSIADSPFDREILCGLVLLVIVALWAGLHFLVRYMRRIRHECPRTQRQGRPSPRGQGRRGKKGRR